MKYYKKRVNGIRKNRDITSLLNIIYSFSIILIGCIFSWLLIGGLE